MFRPSAPRIPRDEASPPGEVGLSCFALHDFVNLLTLLRNASFAAKAERKADFFSYANPAITLTTGPVSIRP